MNADQLPIGRALLSVSDKTGLVDLASALRARGVTLVSTGGTAQSLREADLAVTDVSDVTGFPEILDGRVKTLHPAIHAGILARQDRVAHTQALRQQEIFAIDLVIVSLYPFERHATARAPYEDTVEQIDIGGPAMIRAAAKNHAFVTVVVDPADYPALLDELAREGGCTTHQFRKWMAAKAFARTAHYDTTIARWFAEQAGDPLPPIISFAGRRAETLRYGENPHQQAAFYRDRSDRPGIGSAVQLQGKELSFNNLNDTDAAIELVAEFDRPAVAIIKHANPCGVGEAESLAEAYDKALACDPVSAFGGIVAVNRPLDRDTAEKAAALFLEVVVAPQITQEATQLLAAKKNLRVLVIGDMPDPDVPALTARSVSGGLLVQTRDNGRITRDDLRVVTKRQPSEQEIADMLFAFRVAKHVKSNAIVCAKDGMTVGIGAGQMSRVDSARIAVLKAGDAARAAAENSPRTVGAVVASDAFFPFADGLITAADAGITAAIQPGGSIRDDEVIAAADERDMAMVFTGTRHFRH